jgi:hypothetical protein
VAPVLEAVGSRGRVDAVGAPDGATGVDTCGVGAGWPPDGAGIAMGAATGLDSVVPADAAAGTGAGCPATATGASAWDLGPRSTWDCTPDKCPPA